MQKQTKKRKRQIDDTQDDNGNGDREIISQETDEGVIASTSSQQVNSDNELHHNRHTRKKQKMKDTRNSKNTNAKALKSNAKKTIVQEGEGDDGDKNSRRSPEYPKRQVTVSAKLPQAEQKKKHNTLVNQINQKNIGPEKKATTDALELTLKSKTNPVQILALPAEKKGTKSVKNKDITSDTTSSRNQISEYNVASITVKNDTNITVTIQITSTSPVKGHIPGKRYIFAGKSQYLNVKQVTPSNNFFISIRTKNRRKVYVGLSNRPFTFKKEPFSLIIRFGKEQKPFSNDSIVIIPLEISEATSPIAKSNIEYSITSISSTDNTPGQPEEDSNGSIQY